MKLKGQFSDDELLSSIKSNINLNDAIAFIYREYFDYLSALIIHNSGNMEDARDIVQEVVVNFIETARNDKFRRESSVKTFLHVMTRNTWLNELKKRDRSGRRDKIFEQERLQMESVINPLMEQREAQHQLLAVFGKLGESCKRILTLFYYENLSMREILGQTVYENEQVVRNKKAKCLKELTLLVKNNTTIIDTLKENSIWITILMITWICLKSI